MKELHLLAVELAIICCCTLTAQDVFSNPLETNQRPNADVVSCKILKWNEKSFGVPYLPIREPGRYCIGQDYRMRCSEWSGTCGSGSFIEIYANNVTLDLQGHTLSRTGRPLLIEAVGYNITIRNGTVENGSIFVQVPKAPHGAVDGDAPWVEPDFVNDNAFTVEDIRIEKGSISVIGANATVRRNQVELEDYHAVAPVVVYGPGAIIEDNQVGRDTGQSRSTSYGIYLRYGNGGMIRNNVIKNEGAIKNSVAIGLRKTQSVLVEKNKTMNFSREVENIGTTVAK